jgi:hypothetical protein
MQNLTRMIKKGYSVRIDTKLVKEIAKREENKSVFVFFHPP